MVNCARALEASVPSLLARVSLRAPLPSLRERERSPASCPGEPESFGRQHGLLQWV